MRLEKVQGSAHESLLSCAAERQQRKMKTEEAAGLGSHDVLGNTDYIRCNEITVR